MNNIQLFTHLIGLEKLNYGKLDEVAIREMVSELNNPEYVAMMAILLNK